VGGRAAHGPGRPEYSALAILTALTLKAVFRLAHRQTEGLIGSVIGLLGLELAAPDHSTLCRRAETLEVPRPKPRGARAEAGDSDDAGGGAEPLHLLIDSTGLKLYGAGEWRVEKHGTQRRRSWRKLHRGVDARTGRIVAATLSDRDADAAAQLGPLLDQVAEPVASFTADGAHDQESVYAAVAQRHPDAAVVVPPRATAVPGAMAETAPTRRDRHLRLIAEQGRMGGAAEGSARAARGRAAEGGKKRRGTTPAPGPRRPSRATNA
jgi:Transposase DDE domain